MIEREACIKQNLIYLGLDVDDKQYHGSDLGKNTGEVSQGIGGFNHSWTI